MEQWITQELGRTDLGDKRRTKRLIKIVDNLSAKPEASVPSASGTWAGTKATYDFWDSPYLKPSMIRKGHTDATVERISQHRVVLAIQDTTELNYTSHKALVGAGYLDSKYATGLKVHSTLSSTTLLSSLRHHRAICVGKRSKRTRKSGSASSKTDLRKRKSKMA